MKPIERILIYSALILSIVFWHRSCESETKIIEIPKKIGSFSQVQPADTIVIVDTIFIEIIKKAEQSNDSLLKAYQDLESEFDRFKLFQDFVSVKQFNQKFEDDFLKVDVSGVVRGKVETIGVDYYEIKSQQIEYKTKKVKRFGVGAYLGYDLINTEPSVGVSLNYNLFYLF